MREPVSRRVLCGGVALLAGAAALRLGREARADDPKIPKAQAKFQDHPNGQQRCAICLQFSPPNQCKIVAGTVTPTSWCQFFAARENAQ